MEALYQHRVLVIEYPTAQQFVMQPILRSFPLLPVVEQVLGCHVQVGICIKITRRIGDPLKGQIFTHNTT
jgi:hypothetical protein